MITSVITSSLLITVVIALRFLFKGKISRRLQYALWGLVLLKLLLPYSLLTSPISVMNVVPDSSFGEKQMYVLPLSKQPVAEAAGVSVDANGIVADANSFGYAVLSEDGVTVTRYADRMSIRGILGLVWLMGALAVGLWFIGTNMAFSRRLHQTRREYHAPDCPAAGCATERKLPVYISERIASPCLFGFFHPAVYLTPQAAASEDNTRYALTHELCHYRHGDHIWSVMRCLCLAGWWWNPLVWAAAFFSREDSELACDETVIRQIGLENRLAYGHSLVDMIAVKKTPSTLLCAATTMASGKRSIKGRLNMIVKSPKTAIPALAAVLLILAACAGCTFTGAAKDAPVAVGQDFPAVEMVFSSADSSLEQLGRDAAEFYYAQFMKDDVPQYWHITKYETLTCQPLAGDQAEFAVWVTSRLETDGGGFLVGAGIPNDPNDLSKGGICPEVGRQLRIKALGGGRYEIVSIGTGGGDQGLAPMPDPDSESAGSGQVNTGGSPHLTDLKACVTRAILSANANKYRKGDLATEAHTVLKTVEKGSTTTVYAMALYLEFGFAGSGFSETGGSHMPVAIRFEKNAAGEYQLQEYWMPQDGSYYGPSIKDKFPADIYQDALDTQKYITAHTQVCYEQAIQYGKVSTDHEIARLIAAIISPPASASHSQAYIDAHPLEYRELIYYGKHTLRYSFALFEQGGQTGLEGHIMAAACRQILGNEDINLQAITGQEWYDAFKKSATDLRRQYGDSSLEKNRPGAWLLLQMIDEAGN